MVHSTSIVNYSLILQSRTKTPKIVINNVLNKVLKLTYFN